MSEQSESQIRDAHASGDMARTAELALAAYGRELFGFLVATMGSESDASEVFSQLGEDLWRGLPNFEWRASARTWLYKLARNASAKYRRSPWQAAGRRAGESQISELVERVRTQTAVHLRTETKQSAARLREQLSVEEQEILVLRIDRKLSWEEVAAIMQDDAAEGADIAVAVARYRKRFQLVKSKLKCLAEDAGLLQGRG